MLKMSIKVEGEQEVNAALLRVRESVKRRRPLMKAIAQYLRTYFIKQMNKGEDPEGNMLPPPALWTRIIGLGSGKSRKNKKLIPLVNTGMLRNSMGAVEVTDNSLEFGWRGKQLEKAYRMINGVPGLMQVKNNAMRLGKKNLYVRIQIADNQWRTLKMFGDKVLVKPLKRNFFYLGTKQAQDIGRQIDAWIEATIQGKKMTGFKAA